MSTYCTESTKPDSRGANGRFRVPRGAAVDPFLPVELSDQEGQVSKCNGRSTPSLKDKFATVRHESVPFFFGFLCDEHRRIKGH